MTVEELRIFVNGIANKDQTGNSMTPDQYNSYLARANEDKFRIEFGLRERGPGNPVFFENGIISTDALRPFIDTTVIAAAPAGQFLLPSQYVHANSARTDQGNPVTFINRDELNQSLVDPISFPTTDYPYAVIEGTRIWVYPTTVPQITLTYLSRPSTPRWGFTIINDEPIYDPATSVQFEWDPVYHIDIARLILSYMGINFRDNDLLGYAEQQKMSGA